MIWVGIALIVIAALSAGILLITGILFVVAANAVGRLAETEPSEG